MVSFNGIGEQRVRSTHCATLLAMLSDASGEPPQWWGTAKLALLLGIADHSAKNRIDKLIRIGCLEATGLARGRRYRVTPLGVEYLRESLDIVSQDDVEMLDVDGRARQLLQDWPVDEPLKAEVVAMVRAAIAASKETPRKPAGPPQDPRLKPNSRRAAVLRLVKIRGGHGDADSLVRISSSPAVSSSTIMTDLTWLQKNGWIKPGYQPDPSDRTTWYWLAISKINGD